MVAEKPSMAASIASFLSDGSFSTRSDGACPTHEFAGSFQGRRVTMRVTAVKGHVYNLDFDEAYQNWDMDPEVLFSATTIKVPTSGAVIGHLKTAARGATHLVLWLDWCAHRLTLANPTPADKAVQSSCRCCCWLPIFILRR